MIVGMRIYQLRTQRGMTQEQLAAMIGVSPYLITLWESGQAIPDINMLIALSNIFGVTLDYLCTNTNIAENKPRYIKDSKYPMSKNGAMAFRGGMIALFVLTLLSILIALMTVGIVSFIGPYGDHYGAVNEHMWMFMLFLPIPLSSVVLGIYGLVRGIRCKKNIIAGAIMATLLVIYGSFSFMFADFEHDLGYISKIEQIVDVDLPNNGAITTEYSKTAMSTYESYETTTLTLYDDAEIANFEKTIADDSRFSYRLDANDIGTWNFATFSDSDACLMYNCTTGEYGTVDKNAGEQEIILIAYFKDTATLEIVRFVVVGENWVAEEMTV